MSKSASASAPAHLGFLAFLLVVWHAVLAADYVVVRFGLGFDLPSLTLVFESGPDWVQMGWALGVWLGLLGAIFAMMRDDAAVLTFFATFVAVLAAVIGAELSGPPAMPFDVHRYAVFAALVLVPLIGWVYTRSMKRAGVLS